ncbi:uncharacterized protein F58A4.6 [Halyomorpha halys]|uniref:uncharacterized protein F58A4.6 n=1 Tax=Halyomorpha halys TaxID=286706 RepID=UPI0006D51D1B|nr:uncharacterized protein F58A4.6 [Halyomorpha halys]
MLFLDFKVFFGRNILDEFCLVPCSSNWEWITPDEIIQQYNNEADVFIAILEDIKPVEKFKVIMDSYLASLFYYVIKSSVSYRTLLANLILKKKNNHASSNKVNRILVCVSIIHPKKEMIDYKGNRMFEISCLERRELDHAMAWLSTLGGAFSALGDSIENCATIAGKISVRQLQIAIRLGDPYLAARCKLYMALSLIQKHRFKLAKTIIEAQYLFASQGPIIDYRLKSMCLGIWAKLKYERKMLKELK